MFKKFLKRFISSSIVVSMTLTIITCYYASAAVEPKTDGELMFNDCTSSVPFGGEIIGRYSMDDNMHNGVMKITPSEELKYAEYWAGEDVTNAEKLMVSFDFFAPQTNQPMVIMFRDSENLDFAHIMFDAYGNIVFRASGWAATNLSGSYDGETSYAVPYNSNQWHNICAIVTPNGQNTLIDYYVDGKFAVRANTQVMPKATCKIKNIYIRSTQNGVNCGGEQPTINYDGTQCFYIDNWRISNPNASDKFYARASDITETDTKVKVSFTEPINIDNIKLPIIKDISGNTVSSDSGKIFSDEIYIDLKAPIESGSEYSVIFENETESILNKKLGNPIAVFNVKANTADVDINKSMPYMLYTYSDGTPGETINNSTARPISLEYTDGGDGYGTSLKMTYSKQKAQYEMWVDTMSGNLVDGILFRMDMKTTEGQRSPSISLWAPDASKKAGQCFFDSAGNFVYLKDGANMWTNESDYDPTKEINESKYGVHKLENDGGWHNVLIAYNKILKKVSFYVDGNFAGVGAVGNAVAGGADVQRVFFSYEGESTDEMSVLADNISLSCVKSKNILGDVFDSDEEEYKVDLSNGSGTITSKQLTFSDTDIRNYILSADMKITEPEKNTAKIYLQNSNGELLFSSKIQDADGTLGIYPTSAPWLDNAVVLGRTISGLFGTDEFVNLQFYINRESKTLTLFVNNIPVFMRKGITTADITPSKLYIECAKTDKNGMIEVKNIKSGYTSGNVRVSKIRLSGIDDEYSIFYDDVPSILKNIKIYMSDNIDGASINGILLLNTDTNEYINTTSAYDSEDKVIVTEIPSGYAAPGNYKLKVENLLTTGGSTITPGEYDFSLRKSGDFCIESFAITTDSGLAVENITGADNKKIKLGADIINTTPSAKNLIAYFINYKDGILNECSEKNLIIDSVSKQSLSDFSLAAADLANGRIVAIIKDKDSGEIYKKIVLDSGYTVPDDDKSIKFELKSEPNAEMFIEIIAPLADSNRVVYRDVKAADENGKINIVCGLGKSGAETENAKSGFYTLAATDSKGKTYTDKKFFVNSAEVKSLALAIDAAQSVSEIKDLLTQYSHVFEDVSDMSQIDLSRTSELIYSYVKDENKKLSDADTNGIRTLIKKALRISTIENGTEKNLFKCDEMEIDKSRIKDCYKKTFITERVQEEITSDLKGLKAKTIGEFYDNLTEKFVLRAVYNSDGETNAKDIIQEFSTEIGTGKTGTAAAYRAVSGKMFKSYDELKSAFDKANVDNVNNQGGGGSSSRGGSGGSIGNVSISDEITNSDNDNSQIPYNIFSDIDDVEWAKDAIVYLAEKQIINGKGNNSFCPNDSITREELAKMIVLAFGLEMNENDSSSFSDVSDWARKYVDCAYKNDIVKGYDDYTFGASDAVTREDLTVMIYRAAKNAGKEFTDESLYGFSDANEISDYAKDAVSAFYNEGIINGVSQDVFAPKQNATRAQTAKILYSIIKL